LGLTGAIYGLTAALLTAWFVLLAARVGTSRETEQARMKPERALFKFSILYLFILFGALVVDRLVLA
jgi:protoheme IX farnesyltransferase